MTLPLPATAEKVLDLTPHDVAAILPHRGQKLLITEGVKLNLTQRRADTVRRITQEDCDGHFPGLPIYPGIQYPEIVAQLLGVLAAVLYENRGIGVLAAVGKCSFRAPAQPGEMILVSVRLTNNSPSRLRGNGAVYHENGSLIASVDDVLIVRRPTDTPRSSPTSP